MALELNPQADAAPPPARPALHTAREQWEAWKNVDLMFFPLIAILIGGAAVFLGALTIGDWSYWQDWRDRRWWPLLTPLLLLTLPAVLTYAFWKYFKLPVAATAVAVGYLLSQMISRYVNFHLFTGFPMNWVMPEVWIGAAVFLDATLLITRSFAITGLVGGFFFGLLFYPMNWPTVAPMHMPVQVGESVITLADYMGFQYIRTAMPEYVRIIEYGTLRTFGGHVAPVTAFVAGFFAILVYYVFVWIGSKSARPAFMTKLL